MKEFKGRIVTPGTVTAKAVVTHGGLNTLASFQKALQFGDKNATCGDEGEMTRYCACGDKQTQIIAPTGQHTKQPTSAVPAPRHAGSPSLSDCSHRHWTQSP